MMVLSNFAKGYVLNAAAKACVSDIGLDAPLSWHQ